MVRLVQYIFAGLIVQPGLSPEACPASWAFPAPDKENTAKEVQQDTSDRWGGWTVEQWRERLKQFGPGVPEAERAVSRMIEVAGRTDAPPKLRQQIVLMLGRVGGGRGEALTVLQKILEEPGSGGEIPAAWAAKALARMGPSAAEATPALERVLKSKSADLSVRLGAIDALTQIGGSHPRVVPVLIEWLAAPPVSVPDDERTELRRAAADGLALMKPAPSPAVPQLVRTLDDRDALLRNKAVAALASIGFGAAPAADAVAERLVFDEEPAVREQAARALAAMDSAGIEYLLLLSEDSEDEVRRLATVGLGLSRVSSDQVRGALRKRLGDPAVTVQLAAVKGLQSSAEDRGRVVESLLKLLLSGDRAVRIEAANLLKDVSPTDGEVAVTGILGRIEASPTAKPLWRRFLQQRQRDTQRNEKRAP